MDSMDRNNDERTDEELHTALAEVDAADAPEVAEELTSRLSERLDGATDEPKGADS